MSPQGSESGVNCIVRVMKSTQAAGTLPDLRPAACRIDLGTELPLARFQLSLDVHRSSFPRRFGAVELGKPFGSNPPNCPYADSVFEERFHVAESVTSADPRPRSLVISG